MYTPEVLAVDRQPRFFPRPLPGAVIHAFHRLTLIGKDVLWIVASTGIYHRFADVVAYHEAVFPVLDVGAAVEFYVDRYDEDASFEFQNVCVPFPLPG